jgi:tRNA(fMet)-specific endonuclease VapC
MNGKWYLLDTNIIIALFAQEIAVQARLAETPATFISLITVGELYYGARKSKQTEKNIHRIDEFVANTLVLPCDTLTAQHYGQIKLMLRKKGRPIPENDIWIAALAQQYQLTLVSRDRHFSVIDDLMLETW